MPAAYSPQDRERIIAQVQEGMRTNGQSLREACKEAGISHPTILRWIVEDDAAGGDLSDQFARARGDLRTLVAEDVIGISDNTEEDPASRRVRVETRLKVLARLAPKRWGEKLQNEHSGPGGGPIPIARELTEEQLLSIAAAGNGKPG